MSLIQLQVDFSDDIKTLEMQQMKVTVTKLDQWICDSRYPENPRSNFINFSKYRIDIVASLTLISCTLNKTDVLLNPQKRFRSFLKGSGWVQCLKKRIKKSTKPLMVLPVYPREEPSPAKPFLKFRTAEKGFVGKYETFRVSY